MHALRLLRPRCDFRHVETGFACAEAQRCKPQPDTPFEQEATEACFISRGSLFPLFSPVPFGQHFWGAHAPHVQGSAPSLNPFLMSATRASLTAREARALPRIRTLPKSER
jgi:hypothetical protein